MLPQQSKTSLHFLDKTMIEPKEYIFHLNDNSQTVSYCNSGMSMELTVTPSFVPKSIVTLIFQNILRLFFFVIINSCSLEFRCYR